MLGLADRTRVIDLFESLVRGDIASAFKEFREQYDTGADPVVVLSDLAEFVNFVTRVKIVPATADNVAFGETERLRARDFAAKISMRVLSRMWQMLLKGIAEVQSATRPAATAEMVLVRIAYVADMPTPDEAIRMIEQNGGTSATVPTNTSPRPTTASPVASMPSSPSRPAASPRASAEPSMRPQMTAPSPDVQAAPARRIANFPELVALAGERRDLLTKAALEADVRLVRIEDGRLELALERSANANQRSLAQAGAMDRAALDRDRVQRSGAADVAGAERGGEEHARARRRIRSQGAGSPGAISRRETGRGAQACRRAAGIP